MKARELIEMLEGLDPEKEVYFLPNNSYYAEEISTDYTKNASIHTFWGPDKKGVAVIYSGGQVGSVSEV